ncbi:Helix-turn-helix domain-containing protein [Lentzea waywayandensis]|uniref:Helix-turn-helix domain-containing protein n=1 Tax=Lentzea waywayandensis TaxID=84724 RepID=A0A1I6FI97_9PSEU|nr:helix-turn-helix transcriptional regulator [Lentzea waywayandensis]SFR29660.1 Helix-turn-helix domain-containing protein [Lentzea waywayandensis]
MPRNTASEASNVHEARTALGKRLRELRQHAGLTGKQLAESLAWPPSKISKLENGRQTPTDDDLRAWARITDAPGEVDALLAKLHTLETQHAEWQRLLRTGARAHQSALAELDAKIRFYRVFETMIVPGLLQIPEYAKACLGHGSVMDEVRDDIAEAVQVRMRRQDILYAPDRRFHFVLTEAALRYRLCSPTAMLGQLDRLVSLSTLPNLKLGVIDFRTLYRHEFPTHGFWLLGEDLVQVETFSAELNLAQPQEIELYGKIFESLAGIASYGRAARQIIMRVIDDLSAEVEEDPPTR